MAVQFDLFQISASNPELHATLADSHRHVTSADARSFLGIDLFQHAYDPTAWRAWLVSARAPMFEGITGLAPVPPRAPLATAMAQQGGGAAEATVEGEGPSQLAFLAAHPYVQKLEELIDAQVPAKQRELILASLTAVMNAVKSINLNLYAFKPYRTLCERLWGYYAQGSDPYWVGISGSTVNSLGRGGVGNAAASWRGKAAQRWNALRTTANGGAFYGRDLVGRVDFRDAVEPYAVVFGNEHLYDAAHHGCHVASGGTIGMPINCQAPTAESHALWFQANGSLSGGELPPASVDWRGWVLDAVQWDPFNGSGAMLLGGVAIGGRYRLFATPPLHHYWAMFYLPQPEFTDASGNPHNFIEWMLAQSATELIRSTRRDVVLRNSAVITRHGIANVEALIGRAEMDEVQSQQEKAAIRGAVTGILGGASVALATAVPLAGLIGGVATVVGLLVASAPSGSPEVTHTDVFGQLMPAYLQFAILPSRDALFEARCPGIGWPRGIVPMGQRLDCQAVTDAMVTAAEATRFQGGYVQQVAYATGTAPPRPTAPGMGAPAPLMILPGLGATGLTLALQYASVSVDGMPRFGGVFVDGSQTPLDGRWTDATERVWVVQVPRGAHTLRVAPPDSSAPERTIQLDVRGPMTVRVADMMPVVTRAVVPVSSIEQFAAQGQPQPQAPALAAPAGASTGAPASGGSGGKWVAGGLVTLGLVGAGVAGWKNRRRLLGAARRG